MVSAKDPLKVKLENFHNSRVPEMGELCVPWFVRALGFYSSMGLAFVPWLRRSFLVGEIFFNSRILRDPFLIRLSWLELNMRHKIFPYMLMREGQVKPCQSRQRFAYSLQLLSVNFISRLYILVILFRCLLPSRCNLQIWSRTIDFILSLSGRECASEADEFTKTIALA